MAMAVTKDFAPIFSPPFLFSDIIYSLFENTSVIIQFSEAEVNTKEKINPFSVKNGFI